MSFVSVDAYIAAQPKEVRAALERVRSSIRKALPDAEEVIAYNMPTYKVNGITVIQFAAWKAHYALYLATEPVVAVFKEELRGCEIDKGTLKFSYAGAVPEHLIERIAKFRAGY